MKVKCTCVYPNVPKRGHSAANNNKTVRMCEGWKCEELVIHLVPTVQVTHNAFFILFSWRMVFGWNTSLDVQKAYKLPEELINAVLAESPRAHPHVVGMWRFMSDINQPSLPTPVYSVLVSVSVFMPLSTVFHSPNSPDNSPFSDSVLPVLSFCHVPAVGSCGRRN